jgi:two-component system, chemotaxis family, chemotaxis protein CheY
MKTHDFLIVDDSSTMRTIISKCLNNLGHNIVGEAGNGKKALDKLEELNKVPDFMTLDINMPIMNGVDLLKTLNKSGSYKDMNIIMVTTEKEKGLLRECFMLGATNYLIKPFRETDVIKTINTIIGKK